MFTGGGRVGLQEQKWHGIALCYVKSSDIARCLALLTERSYSLLMFCGLRVGCYTRGCAFSFNDFILAAERKTYQKGSSYPHCMHALWQRTVLKNNN